MGLALTLRKDEKIFIGDDIAFEVHEIQGGQMKIVIEAPKDQRILREKVADEKTRADVLKKTFDRNKQY